MNNFISLTMIRIIGAGIAYYCIGNLIYFLLTKMKHINRYVIVNCKFLLIILWPITFICCKIFLIIEIINYYFFLKKYKYYLVCVKCNNIKKYLSYDDFTNTYFLAYDIRYAYKFVDETLLSKKDIKYHIINKFRKLILKDNDMNKNKKNIEIKILKVSLKKYLFKIKRR